MEIDYFSVSPVAQVYDLGSALFQCITSELEHVIHAVVGAATPILHESDSLPVPGRPGQLRPANSVFQPDAVESPGWSPDILLRLDCDALIESG